MSKPKLQFKIIKNLPIAPIKGGAHRNYKNPYETEFKAMSVGDCMIIGKNDKLKKQINYHAKKWGKKNDQTFVFRNTDDGYKMWRIK